jgi:hypothetical protein
MAYSVYTVGATIQLLAALWEDYITMPIAKSDKDVYKIIAQQAELLAKLARNEGTISSKVLQRKLWDILQNLIDAMRYYHKPAKRGR